MTTRDVASPFFRTYADATARAADTAFTAGDVGKVAWQQSDDTLWILTATTPTWAAVIGGSGGGAVTSVFGRTGAVVATSGDYTVAQVTGAVPDTRQVIAGTAMSGGGTLAADRTLNVVLGTSGSSACAGNDSRLSDARTPTAHAASHLPGGTDALTTAAAGTITPGDSAAVGSAASVSRSDHQHAIAAFGTTAGTFCQGNDSRLGGGSASATQERWNIPASPNADDEEFSGTSLTNFTLYDSTPTSTAITDATIDPYANTTTTIHASAHTYKPHWLTFQGKANSADFHYVKTHTFPTNGVIWCRVGHYFRATAANDDRIALTLYAQSSSKPDLNNRLAIMLRGNSNFTWVGQAFKLVGGVETDPFTANTAGQWAAPPEYFLFQKIGTTYHFWYAWGSGHWCYLGNTTHASTMVYAGFQFRSASVSSGSCIMCVDFLRFVDNTSTYLP